MSSIAGGLKGGGGKGGSDAQALAANIANSTMERANNQNRADLAPWYGAGSSAITELRNLLGLGNKKTRNEIEMELRPNFYIDGDGNGWGGYDEKGLKKAVDAALAANEAQAASPKDASFGSLMDTYTFDDFQKDPTYEFLRGEGQKAIERKLNAQGKTWSPEAAKALSTFNTDYANTKFNEGFDRYNIGQDNVFNRLAALAGYGQNASNTMAAGNSALAGAIGENQIGIGNARAAEQQARNANNSSMFNTLLGAGARLGSAYIMR